MSDTNKTYRIRTEVGTNKNITVKLDQEYNTFEILSLQLGQEDTYRLQSVDYGVIVGRVLANGGFGVPNAKISVFIESEESTYMDVVLAQLYPYKTTRDTINGVRYNLLPDEQVDECHRVVGTFPNKAYVLDNDDVIEIFEKYYKYTTRTNNSGDYIICGVPVGTHTVHMDLDLSDCGVLSQKPRDFFYKGYNVELFDNPNQFKNSENIDSLSQIFTQEQAVNVIPFWGNKNQGDTIGVTRCDIDVNFKFEPTCVFIGSVVSDSSSKGISKRCVATDTMGSMDELVTGEGTIEMIRKRTDGTVEEYQIKGTELINSNGVWCYQIPMNLDYMVTDEYGNLVPTDNPNKGIPTRTSVRFRVSLHDGEFNTDNYFLTKALIPNNPKIEDELDYNFGSLTQDSSFRDLFWNNVYTVKSYIPRFQHSQIATSERFTGIKHCNIYGNNNPIPYNNIRIRLPLAFTMLCAIIKAYIAVVSFMNSVIFFLQKALGFLTKAWGNQGDKIILASRGLKYIVLSDGICPDLDGWYFAPGGRDDLIQINDIYTRAEARGSQDSSFNMLERTLYFLAGYTGYTASDGKLHYLYPTTPEDDAKQTDKVFREKDKKSIDYENSEETEAICLTNNIDYLVHCIEMNLAMEHKVINFDFYNDWLNGTIYLPRWNKYVTKKRSYLFGLYKVPSKIKGCLTSANAGNNSVSFGRNKRYTQQCALTYALSSNDTPKITSNAGCAKNPDKQKCHKQAGFKQFKIFGRQGGVIQEKITSRKDYVYYAKPCEWHDKKVILFATDIVLLGSLNDCNLQGLPQAYKHLSSTTYRMPTNLALTNMDNDSGIYTTINGTVCSGNHAYPGGTPKLIEGTALTNTNVAKYYNSIETNTISYVDADEYLALTEASGIAWNYTGPGQGKIEYVGNDGGGKRKVIYQPGGHFLGVSCTNSQTNIKSCVNLIRVCEAGATISQRREDVKSISFNPSNDTVELSYYYYVPTGLISKGEIVDEDFRTMFATMNQNRLIATGIDPKTGFPVYEYSYKRPSSFDGSIEDYIKAPYNNPWYNRSMSEFVTIEDSGLDKTTDYVSDIAASTKTRTVEEGSRDYYFFRLGIENFSEQQGKYLLGSIAQGMLPQFENSFYFYFGLRPGATAIDEFNKQFFATCTNNNVDDSFCSYKVTTPEDVGNWSYVEYAEVPLNPTKDYPLFIKVYNTFYRLDINNYHS